MAKREAHVELAITPVLGEHFVRLSWTNLGGRDGRELFVGLAIYEEPADGTIGATWWDSSIRASWSARLFRSLERRQNAGFPASRSGTHEARVSDRPRLGFFALLNMSFGFFGIQFASSRSPATG